VRSGVSSLFDSLVIEGKLIDVRVYLKPSDTV